jgi:hypothetical protein
MGGGNGVGDIAVVALGCGSADDPDADSDRQAATNTTSRTASIAVGAKRAHLGDRLCLSSTFKS